jgi:signal recognition particle subunit SRP54
MFESLQDSLSSALKSLTGKARLTESNMRDGLALVQQSLLEADVSYAVVKEFMARVTEQAIGEQVLKSLNPSQQVVGIVYEELKNLMGPVDHSLHLKPDVTVLMMCGLQGSGKTTTCGKLGRMIKQRGRQPLLVAADLQRPAAIEQLKQIGARLGIPVYSETGAQDPVVVCQNATKHARETNANVIILDTAGRLHIDEELMEQLKRIDRRVSPEQVYLVVDGMTGQDAVNSAKAFNDALELDGVIMTKLDGDTRGGAALSVKAVTGVPLKFMGTGEHLEDLEEFHPDRMAGRILGLGDIRSLVEQAQEKFDQEEMERQQQRLQEGQFTLDDFRRVMNQAQRLGPLGKIMKLIPGMGDLQKLMGNADHDKEMRRVGGMIDSMTADERRNPKLIDQSRRRRIAAGAGVEPAEINALVKQFDGMADLMKSMSSMGMRDRMRKLSEIQQGMASNPMGVLGKAKVGTGKRLTTQEKAKLRKEREKELRKKKREGRGN